MERWPRISLPLYLTNETKQLVETHLPMDLWYTLVMLSKNAHHIAKVSKGFHACIQYLYTKLDEARMPAPLIPNTALPLTPPSKHRLTLVRGMITKLLPNQVPAQTQRVIKRQKITNTASNASLVATTTTPVVTLNPLAMSTAIPAVAQEAFTKHISTPQTPLDKSPESMLGAISQNNVPKLKSLLASGALVSAEVIEFACAFNDATIIDLLLSAQSGTPPAPDTQKADSDFVTISAYKDPSTVDHMPSTLSLYDACVYCDKASIDAALTSCPDQTSKAKMFDQLICTALQVNNLDTLTLLVDRGADLKHRDHLGNTYLHTALELGCHSGILTYLLEKKLIPINSTNDFEETALIVACKKGLFKQVQTLIAHKADLSGKNTPLAPCVVAYQQKRYDIVCLLRFHEAPCPYALHPRFLLQAIAQEDIPHIKALLALNAAVGEKEFEVALRTGNQGILVILSDALAKE